MKFGWEFWSGRYGIVIYNDDVEAARAIASDHFNGQLDKDREPKKIGHEVFEFWKCPPHGKVTMGLVES